MSTPSIGDVVEVRFVELNGIVARELWRSASVIYVDDSKLGVQFKDHSRLMVPLRSSPRRWR